MSRPVPLGRSTHALLYDDVAFLLDEGAGGA